MAVSVAWMGVDAPHRRFWYSCIWIVTHPVKQNRVVRNPNYGWRALRLLSRRSPHFFQPTNQKFKSLADYLDSMVSKLAKELPVSLYKYRLKKKKKAHKSHQSAK